MDTNWKCRNSWILPGLHDEYSLKRGGYVRLVSVRFAGYRIMLVQNRLLFGAGLWWFDKDLIIWFGGFF